MKRSMMQAYIKNSDQAVQFYRDAFDAKVVCDHRNESGKVAHAELDIYGQIFAICESDKAEVETGDAMQFCLHFGEGSDDLVQNIIDKLSVGGRYTYDGPSDWSPHVAGIIDRFGINWCIFV